MNISEIFVTMYYGTNEKLGTEPITIRSHDLPETPYDDRYIVVHLQGNGVPDETDQSGDTDCDGHLDVSCNNYAGSLWNTDGVVSLDSDDDPGNDGILDFLAYANHDGTLNAQIADYISIAAGLGRWQGTGKGGSGGIAVDIGPDGLDPGMSIMRLPVKDTDTPADFTITSMPTPGSENIALAPGEEHGLISLPKKRIAVVAHGVPLEVGGVPLVVIAPCSIRLSIFSMTGRLLHASPLETGVEPGPRSLTWPLAKTSRTGLYLGRIEAVAAGGDACGTWTLPIIVSHYR